MEPNSNCLQVDNKEGTDRSYRHSVCVLIPMVLAISLLTSLITIGCRKGNQTAMLVDPDSVLTFVAGDSFYKDIDLQMMVDHLELTDISFYDVHFEKIKNHRAVLFNQLLDYSYGDHHTNPRWIELSLVAKDGFTARIDKQYFDSDAYLIIGDNEYSNWEAIPGHGGETTAPFYLVWTHPDKTPKNGFPWPWQVVSIELLVGGEDNSIAVPDSSLADRQTLDGYHLFKSRCSVCHAISGDGGMIGPDLNKPRNILEYRSDEMVRAFISQSSSFRIGRMPDFNDLSEKQLDDLLSYLDYLKEQKEGY